MATSNLMLNPRPPWRYRRPTVWFRRSLSVFVPRAYTPLVVDRADRASAVDLGTPRLAHADVVLAGLVVVALFAFFLAIQRGEYASYDGRIMAGVTRNLWEHGRLQSFGPLFPDGPLAEVYSQYGVGQSLLLLPFYGLQRLDSADGAQWMTLANPIVLACCGACLYVIGISIRLRRSTSIGMAFAFGTLTMAPLYSTELFAEPAVTLGTLGVVLGLVRWRSQCATGPWLVGVGTAFSVLFRVDALLLVGAAALAIPMFVPWRRLCATWKQWLPAVALPVATVGLWQGYYNNLRYGAPLRDSYSGVSFDNPMLNGLGRQLLSPGKGFFWYNTILLAALPGLVWLWRRDRSLTMLLVGIAVLRVSFVARVHHSPMAAWRGVLGTSCRGARCSPYRSAKPGTTRRDGCARDASPPERCSHCWAR